MVDAEADQIAAALDQHGVAEGQPVDDLDLLGDVEPAAHRVGDAVEARERGLLLGLLERRVAPDYEPAPGRPPRPQRVDLGAVEHAAHDRAEPLRPVAELVEEQQVLGAARVRHHALDGRLVLVEELLDGPDELLGDALVLVIGEHGHGAEQPQRAPRDSQRDAHELLLILLGDEAAPRLHEPAVMDVLGPLEGLAGTRAELPLEEIPEGLLEHVADSRKIALLDPADLDLSRAPLGVLASAVDGCPHAGIRPGSSRSWTAPE